MLATVNYASFAPTSSQTFSTAAATSCRKEFLSDKRLTFCGLRTCRTTGRELPPPTLCR